MLWTLDFDKLKITFQEVRKYVNAAPAYSVSNFRTFQRYRSSDVFSALSLVHFRLQVCVPAGSPSRGGDVADCVF